MLLVMYWMLFSNSRVNFCQIECMLRKRKLPLPQCNLSGNALTDVTFRLSSKNFLSLNKECMLKLTQILADVPHCWPLKLKVTTFFLCYRFNTRGVTTADSTHQKQNSGFKISFNHQVTLSSHQRKVKAMQNHVNTMLLLSESKVCHILKQTCHFALCEKRFKWNVL